MIENVSHVDIGAFKIGDSNLPVLIAGPCVIESKEHARQMAETIAEIAEKYEFPYIYKTSYDKANRSSIHSYRGPGFAAGLEILQDIKSSVQVPVLTDIHDVTQVKDACSVVDMIQIPAFLCRQTDLYEAAGKYSTPVNVKKGQFMAPSDMKNIIEKARQTGIKDLTLTERGVSFGYNRLVVDFTALPIMRSYGVPIVFDATHSLQLPGAGGTFTAGNREFVPYLCRAAVAVGCDALFLEVHDDPDKAFSDSKNMVTPEILIEILHDVRLIYQALWD